MDDQQYRVVIEELAAVRGLTISLQALGQTIIELQTRILASTEGKSQEEMSKEVMELVNKHLQFALEQYGGQKDAK